MQCKEFLNLNRDQFQKIFDEDKTAEISDHLASCISTGCKKHFSDMLQILAEGDRMKFWIDLSAIPLSAEKEKEIEESLPEAKKRQKALFEARFKKIPSKSVSVSTHFQELLSFFMQSFIEKLPNLEPAPILGALPCGCSSAEKITTAEENNFGASYEELAWNLKKEDGKYRFWLAMKYMEELDNQAFKVIIGNTKEEIQFILKKNDEGTLLESTVDLKQEQFDLICKNKNFIEIKPVGGI